MSSTDVTVPPLVGDHPMCVELGSHREELDELPRGAEGIDHLVERSIREPVAVGGQELVVVVEIRLDGLQPLADRRLHPGVDERDPPPPDVALEQLDMGLGAVSLEHEVVEERLVVVEEVLADDVALVAEAENELRVPPGRVVPHDVPEDRAVADPDHRLRDALGLLAHPHAEPAAEDDDLHPVTPAGSAPGAKRIACGTGTTSVAPHSAV